MTLLSLLFLLSFVIPETTYATEVENSDEWTRREMMSVPLSCTIGKALVIVNAVAESLPVFGWWSNALNGVVMTGTSNKASYKALGEDVEMAVLASFPGSLISLMWDIGVGGLQLTGDLLADLLAYAEAKDTGKKYKTFYLTRTDIENGGFFDAASVSHVGTKVAAKMYFGKSGAEMTLCAKFVAYIREYLSGKDPSNDNEAGPRMTSIERHGNSMNESEAQKRESGDSVLGDE